jgi:hypothetical protein
MQVNARTFQLLTAVRQTTLNMLNGGNGGITLPTPSDLHQHIMAVRDRDRTRYGKSYIAPSNVEEMVTRLVDADLLSWDDGGLALSPKASVMVDSLDTGGVNPFEDRFFDDYKEQVALAALTYLHGLNPEPPTMASICAVAQMSDHSLRRGLMTLKDKGEVEVLTDSRLHSYQLTVPPMLTLDEEPSVDEILGLDGDDGPITVADLDAAANIAVAATVRHPEATSDIVVDDGAAPEEAVETEAAPAVDTPEEVPEEELEAGVERLQANIAWLRVPQDIQNSFALRAKVMGLSLTVYLKRLDEAQALKLREALL